MRNALAAAITARRKMRVNIVLRRFVEMTG
jgi:hypothetical protein